MGVQTRDQALLDVIGLQRGDRLVDGNEAMIQQSLDAGVAPLLLLGGRHTLSFHPLPGAGALAVQPGDAGTAVVGEPGGESLGILAAHAAASSPVIQP